MKKAGLPFGSLEQLELALEEQRFETMYEALLRGASVTYLTNYLYRFIKSKGKDVVSDSTTKKKNQKKSTCSLM